MLDAAAAPAVKPRILGRGALLAASIGVIVAQVGMVAVAQGIGVGGIGFIVAMIVAFALALMNAMAYAKMALMMPGAGSLSSYAEVALGNFPAILVVFAGYVTPVLFGFPVELILANQILTEALPVHFPPYTWPVVLVTVFAGLNILGTDVFARLQTALSVAVLVFLLVTGVVAVSGHGAAPLPPGPASGWPALRHDTATVGLLALAFWVFVGSEFVTPLVDEARDPERDLPRAMLSGLAVIFVAELLFALGCAFYVPRQVLMTSGVPHLLYAVAVFGPGARIWFAVLALLATASLLNTATAAVSRMLCGMAANGQVFPVFGYVSPRFKTPVVAIVFVGVLPLLGLAWSGGDPNAILPLTIASSVAWMLAYIMAQISLLVLRRRYPRAHRPFRAPGYPVVPVVAAVGMIYVIAHCAPTPELAPVIARYTAVVLAIFAVVGALWVKLVMKRGLFEPVISPQLAKTFQERA